MSRLLFEGVINCRVSPEAPWEKLSLKIMSSGKVVRLYSKSDLIPTSINLLKATVNIYEIESDMEILHIWTNKKQLYLSDKAPLIKDISEKLQSVKLGKETLESLEEIKFGGEVPTIDLSGAKTAFMEKPRSSETSRNSKTLYSAKGSTTERKTQRTSSRKKTPRGILGPFPKPRRSSVNKRDDDGPSTPRRTSRINNNTSPPPLGQSLHDERTKALARLEDEIVKDVSQDLPKYLPPDYHDPIPVSDFSDSDADTPHKSEDPEVPPVPPRNPVPRSRSASTSEVEKEARVAGEPFVSRVERKKKMTSSDRRVKPTKSELTTAPHKRRKSATKSEKRTSKKASMDKKHKDLEKEESDKIISLVLSEANEEEPSLEISDREKVFDTSKESANEFSPVKENLPVNDHSLASINEPTKEHEPAQETELSKYHPPVSEIEISDPSPSLIQESDSELHLSIQDSPRFSSQTSDTSLHSSQVSLETPQSISYNASPVEQLIKEPEPTEPDSQPSQQEKQQAAEKREEFRKKVVTEIYTTEKFYVDSLKYVIEYYQKPLTAQCESLGITPQLLSLIFNNIEVLFNFNTRLLEEISKITSVWTVESVISPMFNSMVHFLKMYTVYSNRYASACQTLKKELEVNEKFKKEVNSISANSGSGLDLFAYLIMPIQRIPRYSLLLRDLMKYTAEDHPDYQGLSECLQTIGQVASHINEELRRFENTIRFEEMQKKGLDLKTFIVAHRSFIKDGIFKVTIEPASWIPNPLETQPKKAPKDYHLILFNDLFLHIKANTSISHSELNVENPKFVWPLELVWVEEANDGEIKILGPSEKITFYDKEWATLLKKAILERLEIKNRNKKSKRKTCTDQYRIGTFTFLDGAQYDGRWYMGKPDGRGTWTYLGATYYGEWKNGIKSGKGHYTYQSREAYFGYWEDGKPHGKGEVLYPDGSTLCGHWEHGIRSGSATLVYENTNILRGIFKSDKMVEGEMLYSSPKMSIQGPIVENAFHGLGMISYADGSTYEGDIKEGLKHGRGLMRYSNDSEDSRVLFLGSWENDVREGFGTLVDGKSVHRGHWSNDKPHIEGVKLFHDGTIYDGHWESGLRSGKGKCYYSDASVYEGDWLNDLPHGEGTYRDTTGLQYTGSWVNGIKQGKGKYVLANGASFEGFLHNGLPNKYGVFYGGNGDFIKSYDGDWLNGLFHGKGALVLANNDTYQGGFLNNNFHGDGVYTTANSTLYEGKWEGGAFAGKTALALPAGWLSPISPLLPIFPVIAHSLALHKKLI